MELDMKKNIKSTDKISEGTLHEILLDIKYRLDHLEDIEADNRALIVKMIKQGNSIVKFLAQIDVEPIDSSFEGVELPPIKKDKSFPIIPTINIISENWRKRYNLKLNDRNCEILFPNKIWRSFLYES